MDPRRGNNRMKWRAGSSSNSTGEVTKEQDLISKLDKSPDENLRSSDVDCTLKLGLSTYQSPQLPSSTNVGVPQAHPTMPVSNNVRALPPPQAAAYNYATMNGYYGAPSAAGRINYGSSTGGSYMPYGGPPSLPPTPPVICNNYGNLYYLNPQNNVAVNNNFQLRAANPRVEPSRKCLVCETSTTPLWRRGPDGEKSLCNACGIRYRKCEKKKMESTESKSN